MGWPEAFAASVGFVSVAAVLVGFLRSMARTDIEQAREFTKRHYRAGGE